MTTGEDLDRLERLERAATPRPWRHYREPLRPGSKNTVNEVQAVGEPPIVQWTGFDDSARSKSEHAANARFIAALRNAAPSLIADAREIERLRAVERIARAIVAEADADRGMYGPEHHGIAYQFRAVLEPEVAPDLHVKEWPRAFVHPVANLDLDTLAYVRESMVGIEGAGGTIRPIALVDSIVATRAEVRGESPEPAP